MELKGIGLIGLIGAIVNLTCIVWLVIKTKKNYWKGFADGVEFRRDLGELLNGTENKVHEDIIGK